MADGFSVLWDGLKQVEAQIEKVAKQADAAAKTIATQGAALMEREAKANFSGSRKRVKGPRGGRAYDPPHHVGGDKPNVITGALRRSIRHERVTRYGMSDYGTSVSPHTVYARRVELGYRGSAKYPYFEPAAEKVKPLLQAMAAATWARFLRP